jgi:hypothetical protein
MKKLLFVLFLLFTFTARAQFPVNQTLGSPTTTTLIKGVAGAQYGLVIQASYADTTSINNNTTLDNVPGVIVRTTTGALFIRSTNASFWTAISGDSNIESGTKVYSYGYNKNTSILNPFRFVSNVQYLGPVVPSSYLELQADSAWYRITLTGKVPNKTGGHFVTQSDSLNRLTSVGLDPTYDSTTGFQALFTKTAASFGYRTGAVYNNASAVVKGINVDATTKVTVSGLSLLLPRLTTVQRTAIVSPDEGLAVYDTTLHKLYVFDGTTWQAAW